MNRAGESFSALVKQAIAEQSPSFDLSVARDFDIMLQLLARLAEFSNGDKKKNFTNLLLREFFCD